MKDSLTIGLLVMFCLLGVANLYMGFYNQHNFNEHVAEHDSIMIQQKIHPQELRVTINYVYPHDTATIQKSK